MVTAILSVVSLVLQFAMAIFSECLSASARAREEQKKYEIDRAERERLVSAAVARMREDAKKESRDARDVEDRLDKKPPA